MENVRLHKRLLEEFENLMVISEEFIESKEAAHIIEKGILKQLLVLGKTLLLIIINERIKRIAFHGAPQYLGKPIRSKGIESRQYLSLFGQIAIERPSYWDAAIGKVHPTDSELSLPVSSFWSYNIEEIIGESAAECDFNESVRIVNKLLDLRLSGKSSERNIGRLGVEVEDFYKSTPVVKEVLPVCFSASFDGKGVPKITDPKGKEEWENPKKRLGKGEKRGIMQMATVSVTSSFIPMERTVEDILKGLMGETNSKSKADKAIESKKNQDNKWHENIHRRAFLGDQNKAVEYGLDRIKESIGNSSSRFVVPIDAGIGLEEKVLEWVKKSGIEDKFDGIILDIIHVSEYVWNAATAIFGEKSKCKSPWVRDMLTDILNSKTTKVLDDLTRIANQTQLSNSKKMQLEKIIGYFTNHQHKMDYKMFIQKGYPVSSALVESACGHLVKERMEQSGMRWSSQGAQNVMDMRAVKQNGDLEDFMKYRIETEQSLAFKYVA